MTLEVVASSDADALAIRDHILPIVRRQGILEDLEDKDSSLRLFVLEQASWRLPLDTVQRAHADTGFFAWIPSCRRTSALAAGPALRAGCLV